MGKQTKRRVVLSDYKAKAKDRSIDIEGEDGVTYSALPPDLWPDQVFTFISNEDLIGAAKAIMPDYDQFVANGGGSAAVLMSIVKDQEGSPLGE